MSALHIYTNDGQKYRGMFAPVALRAFVYVTEAERAEFARQVEARKAQWAEIEWRQK